MMSEEKATDVTLSVEKAADMTLLEERAADVTLSEEKAVDTTLSEEKAAEKAVDMTLSEERAAKERKQKKMKRRFPDAFYCAITKKILKDPVVTPLGDSYERSSIASGDGTSTKKNYANRALASVIEERVGLSGSSIRSGMHSMRNILEQVLENSAIPSASYRPLNDSFYCPITFLLMHVPVIDPEGNTYERSAIISWIRANKSSPITRTAMKETDLYPNKAIANLLEIEKGRDEDSIHPSIRRWKDDAIPSIRNLEEGNAVSYPTTREEILARLNEQRPSNRSVTGFALVIVVLIGFALFFTINSAVVFFLFGLSLVFAINENDEE